MPAPARSLELSTKSFDELILFWLEIPYYQIGSDTRDLPASRSFQVSHCQGFAQK